MCIFLSIDRDDLTHHDNAGEHSKYSICYDSDNKPLTNVPEGPYIHVEDGHVQLRRINFADYFIPWQPPFSPIEFEVSGTRYQLCLKGQEQESAEYVEFIKNEFFLAKGDEVKLNIPADIVYLLGTQVDPSNRRIVSSSMEEVFEKIRICSTKDDAAVSIYGETGTGKSYIAKIIHLNSRRKNYKFIKLDCRTFKDKSISSTEFDSMLFGDSKNNMEGLLQQANKGVLYIDYFDEIPLPFQARLYNAIKIKKGRSAGSLDYYPIDVRILVGSERKLELLKQEKIIQEDFYYYLAGLKISLPSLKERQDDIVGIAQAFLHHINEAKDQQQVLDESFEKSLKEFAFFLPGNIDQLKSFITACSTNCRGTEITRSHVPDEYFTFGVNENSPLVKFFIHYLTRINYLQKSTQDLAMSLTSAFYINTKLIDSIKEDKSLYDAIVRDYLQSFEDKKLSTLVKNIVEKKSLPELIDGIVKEADFEDLKDLGDVITTLDNTIDDIILSSLERTPPDQRPKKLGKIGEALRYKSRGNAVSQRIRNRIATKVHKIKRIADKMKNEGKTQPAIDSFVAYIKAF